MNHRAWLDLSPTFLSANNPLKNSEPWLLRRVFFNVCFFPRKESWPASVWASSSITRCRWTKRVCLMRNSGERVQFPVGLGVYMYIYIYIYIYIYSKKYGSPCLKSPKPKETFFGPFSFLYPRGLLGYPKVTLSEGIRESQPLQQSWWSWLQSSTQSYQWTMASWLSRNMAEEFDFCHTAWNYSHSTPIELNGFKAPTIF